MKLWHLTRKAPPSYDQAAGFVIAAPTESNARLLAAKADGHDGPTWIRRKNSTCELLGLAASPDSYPSEGAVILRDFRAS